MIKPTYVFVYISIKKELFHDRPQLPNLVFNNSKKTLIPKKRLVASFSGLDNVQNYLTGTSYKKTYTERIGN